MQREGTALSLGASGRRLALCLCLGLCLASKEATRYTAVWYFDAKSPGTLGAILVFCALALAGVALADSRLPVRLRGAARAAACALLTAFQTFGLVVHALQGYGLAFAPWVDVLAWLGKDGALVLLALYSASLLGRGSAGAVGLLGSGIVIAGCVQILLCFVQVDAARVFVCLLPLAALGCWVAGTRGAGPADLSQVDGAQAARPQGEGARAEAKELFRSCLYVFFVSVLLMCSYANWRVEQDGGMASLLIQLTSGAGLLMGGAALWAGRGILGERPAFLACRDVAFPAALAAVYLSTLFSGPGASLPVLLFDIAYAIILAIIWLEPLHGARGLGVPVWLCAGFLSYKAGWYVGVLTLATLQVPWLATATTVCALTALMALTVAQFVARSRERQQEGPATLPTERDYFALACAKVQDDFGLTAREMDVFGLLARGRTSAYIQKALSISDGTARTHISHIYKKLGVKSQQALLDVVEETMATLAGEESTDVL